MTLAKTQVSQRPIVFTAPLVGWSAFEWIGAELAKHSSRGLARFVAILVRGARRHVSATKAVELAFWIFQSDDMNVRALRWWWVKGIFITNGRPHIHARSVIRTPENLIAFVDEKVDEWIA